MPPILYYDLSFRVVGAAMEVHTQLGPGYLEKVYQKALAHEFMLRQIQFVDFVKLPVAYKGVYVGDYIADFVVEDKIVVEIKAATTIHRGIWCKLATISLHQSYDSPFCSISGQNHWSNGA